MITESLTPKPGIREQHRSWAERIKARILSPHHPPLITLTADMLVPSLSAATSRLPVNDS
jgi:hypothetical protein